MYFQFRHLYKEFLLYRRRFRAKKFVKKIDFKRFKNNDFLFDNVIVKNLNISDDDFSNDMIDVILILNN